MSQETIEQTFPVEGLAHLTVINIRGKIDIQPGDDGVINVTAVKHLNSGNADRTEVILTQDEDGAVTARTKFENNTLSLFGLRKGSPLKIDYHITAPQNTSVVVKGVANDAVVNGLDGDHLIKTVSGDVRGETLSGKTEMNTVSGNISAAGTTGILVTKSVSGRTIVTESDLVELTAESVSGNFKAELATAGEGPYKFKTVSGNARLQFREDPRGTVSAKTLSGHIRTPWGSKRARGTFTAGSGDGPHIGFSSVSGDLKVFGPGEDTETRIAATLEQTPEIETAAASQPLSRQEILDKIASGELTVDEAIGALNG